MFTGKKKIRLFPCTKKNLLFSLMAIQNKAKAVECYKDAVGKGHAKAQNSLGYMYEKGLGGLKVHV